MTESTDTPLSLPDIPDLTGMMDPSRPEPFGDGWYAGTILGTRTFTDKTGNERIFETTDAPSANGDSRNIRLQVALTRASDKKTFNTNTLINYRPEDLSAEIVQQVTKQAELVKNGEEWGPLFRSFMTLNRLGKLQRIAGVRQLQRNGNGGLDLHLLFGKTGYFRLAPDDRNPEYKAVVDFRDTAPKKVL